MLASRRRNGDGCKLSRGATAAGSAKGPPPAKRVGVSTWPTPNVRSATKLRAGEDPMVEIRVAFADAAYVHGLRPSRRATRPEGANLPRGVANRSLGTRLVN
jgi:hypothetical protein